MTWKQTLDYLYDALPVFHRIGAAAYKASLDNTYAICKKLDHPETEFKSIHVAGTNGKGSISHMLAAILQQAGYKTGLYTSPHLKDFRERIRINGRMISRQEVIHFTEMYKADFEKIKPSFFEMTVGLAFDYFRNNKVDIAVIETGLGGRLDSTNVITPEISIITNIGWDHMNLLGDTLQKIATEKAGIIKPGVPVIIGETKKETKNIFIERANALHAPIVFADAVYQVSTGNRTSRELSQFNILKNKKVVFQALQLDLKGLYQAKNIKSVLFVTELLNKKGYSISEKNIRSALKNVSALTGLQGRWQTLSKNPLTICDTGHNVDGIREVIKQIRLTPHKNLHVVLGMVSDKDISSVLQLLPKKAHYYFCQANIPRAMNAFDLATKAYRFNLKGDVIPNVKKAMKTVQKNAGKKDLVFVGGSTFVVGEVV